MTWWGVSTIVGGLGYVINPFKSCDKTQAIQKDRASDELFGGALVDKTGIEFPVRLPEVVMSNGDTLAHSWTKDDRFTGLPDTIEDYFTPETVSAIMDWLRGRDKIPEMNLAEECDPDDSGMMMMEAFVDGKMPVQLFNLYVAHEHWEEVHEKLNKELSAVSKVLRRANLWNMAGELHESKDHQRSAVHHETLDLGTYDFLTETEDEETFTRRGKGKEKATGNETDCEEVFGHPNQLLDKMGKKRSKKGKSSFRPDDQKYTGTVKTKRLLDQYGYYTNRCKESILLLNTFTMLEVFIVQSLRELASQPRVHGSRDMEASVGMQLNKIDQFSRYTMNRSRVVLLQFDDTLEILKHTQDCFAE